PRRTVRTLALHRRGTRGHPPPCHRLPRPDPARHPLHPPRPHPRPRRPQTPPASHHRKRPRPRDHHRHRPVPHRRRQPLPHPQHTPTHRQRPLTCSVTGSATGTPRRANVGPAHRCSVEVFR